MQDDKLGVEFNSIVLSPLNMSLILVRLLCFGVFRHEFAYVISVRIMLHSIGSLVMEPCMCGSVMKI